MTLLEPGMVAVVTGAASGIGRSIAEALLDRGLVVVLLDVERDAVMRTVAELEARGQRVEPEVADVRDPVALDAVAARVLRRHGRVDVLVNNAGVVGPRRRAWEQTAEDWRWLVEVNLLGVAHGVRSFVPAMVAAGSGHVVNTASVAGLAPVPGGGNAPYAATKHAVVGLSETLRADLDAAAPSVGVTVLCPGPVPTRIHDSERHRSAPAASEVPVLAAEGLGPLEPVPLEQVGRDVVAAIERDRFYLPVGVGTAELARARAEQVLHGLAAAARA
jgi:NAD(P)-dependent dehydrogenase (short-subunit alcohol dehydrogenase family)